MFDRKCVRGRQFLRKEGKGKDAERSTPRSRSGLSRSKTEKEPSPKTRERLLSTLTLEVKRTRIPKVSWVATPDEVHENPLETSTSSAPLSSLPASSSGGSGTPTTSQAPWGAMEDITMSRATAVHPHVTGLEQRSYELLYNPLEEYSPSTSLDHAHVFPALSFS